MERDRIAVVLTGGTIESRFIDDERALSGGQTDIGEFLRRRPSGFYPSAQFKTYRATDLLSENMVPSDWETIANTIARAYTEGASSVIVAHGTDTMAFTCAAVSFILRDIPIPVVFTGAMRPLEATGSDGPRNFWDAATACIESPYGGVFLMFDGKGYVGTHVRSMRSGESNFAPLEDRGYVFHWDEKVRPRKFVSSEPPMPVPRDHQLKWRHEPLALDPRVALFRAYPGFDPRLMLSAASAEIGAQAVVLELYHSGTGCTRTEHEERYALQTVIRQMDARGILVFGAGTPRVRRDQYQSTSILENSGMVPLGQMTPETAVVKAMYLLGAGFAPADFRREMQRDLVGEFGWYKLSPIGQKVVRSA
jgi:L-asparaginase/Glu-tRNA(Gln) amidotransferase subunit D